MISPLHVSSEEQRAELRRAALHYHEHPVPGKIAVEATKQLVNQHELALAYSPGVAAPWRSSGSGDRLQVHRARQPGGVIQRHRRAWPGRHRALAGKPVMEGKAVLFKKFSASTCSTSRSTKRTRTS